MLPLPFLFADVIVLFLGIAIHEYCHCKFADMAGDPTPAFYGRVTLVPWKHWDPLGSLMIVFTMASGFGIGWGKSAPCNPSKMRDPRWDFFVSVLAGPMSNLLQALLYGVAFRIFNQKELFSPVMNGAPYNPNDFLAWFLFGLMVFGVLSNLGMMLFNLIPFGPLDGHWLFGLLLPERQRLKYFRFNDAIGFPGLIIAVLILEYTKVNFLGGAVTSLFKLITGTPW